MKMSLIEMVIDIANDMDTDPVNAITDTDEAMQIAQIIKTSYYDIISNRNWSHLKGLTQIHHSGTPDLPTHLKLPENTKEVTYVGYDTSKTANEVFLYKELIYKDPEDFLRHVSTKSQNVQNKKVVTDPSGIKLIVVDNKPPTYWTSFDDQYIVCDSYDHNVDDALQKTKTQVIAYRMPEWKMLDDFVPDLPAEAFSALLAESKSAAFFSLKQMANDKAEQRAVRQQAWLSRKEWTAHGGVKYPDFGRRGRK